MNVLEIYPNFSWWFEGRTVEDSLKRLVLESRIKSWLTETGSYRFQPDFFTDETPAHDTNVGLRPVWMVR